MEMKASSSPSWTHPTAGGDGKSRSLSVDGAPHAAVKRVEVRIRKRMGSFYLKLLVVSTNGS
jgi:hypothetical protein